MSTGPNPQASQPGLAKQINHARRRGAKLIVVDPRRHALVSKADCWLRVRPGSDGACAGDDPRFAGRRNVQ